MSKEYTYLDDMDYSDDGEHHILDITVNLDIRCSKCDNRYPITDTEWDESGYFIKIKPHICEWFEPEHNPETCLRMRKMINLWNDSEILPCKLCDKDE